MAKQKKALGRGLSAILSNPNTDITSDSANESNEMTSLGSIAEIAVNTIEVNPFQPRTHFDQNALNELAQSIKELGVIQPITVRKLGYDKYQLISGERRFRASISAGLKSIPAYIRVANDKEMLEMALVENIQRQELDAIEVALSYQLLIDECNLTQEQVSTRVGKKRSTITNYLRLLRLSPIVQAGIKDRMISMGHAKSLVTIENEDEQEKLYMHIIAENLTVRDVELLVKSTKTPSSKRKNIVTQPLPFSYQQLIKQFEEKSSLKSAIKLHKNGKGKLLIDFNSEDELEQLIKCFKFDS